MLAFLGFGFRISHAAHQHRSKDDLSHLCCLIAPQIFWGKASIARMRTIKNLQLYSNPHPAAIFSRLLREHCSDWFQEGLTEILVNGAIINSNCLVLCDVVRVDSDGMHKAIG